MKISGTIYIYIMKDKFMSQQRKVYLAEWRKQNKEKIKQYRAEWYLKNKNHEKRKLQSYRKSNRGIVNFWNRKRNASVKQATPIWADLDDIKNVYIEAAYMQLVVDHIVPLQHPLVCGLHVWDNLQLLTDSENSKKSNTFIIE